MGVGPHELDELLHALRGGAGREEEQEQGGHRESEDGAASGDELDVSNPRKRSNSGLYLSELKAGAYISSQCTQQRRASEMKPRAAESFALCAAFLASGRQDCLPAATSNPRLPS